MLFKEKRILAIDDNAVNLATLEKALSDEYEVIPMISGRRAIKFLMCEKVDLILLDVQMPTMDGIETLTEIRKTDHGVTVPVIFLTAMKDRNTVIEGSKLGIMDYVTKPFVTSDLKARIESVFNRVQGTPIDDDKLRSSLKEILSILSLGSARPAIPKIEYLLDFQLEDEIFKRLKNVVETLEKNDVESGIKKIRKILEITGIPGEEVKPPSLSGRELYMKLLCIKSYLDRFSTQNAISQCQSVLQCDLPDKVKDKVQVIANQLLNYEDEDAKAGLIAILDDLGRNINN